MVDTICVLALDAADYGVIKKLNCNNILLEEHGKLEVFSHNFDVPQTMEVWPSVATGTSPKEHGISNDPERWRNPILRRASSISSWLPDRVRELLGIPFQMVGAERSMQTIATDHAFDEVYGWPGVTDSKHLQQAWEWYHEALQGELPTEELDHRMRANTGKELGWLASMSRSDARIVGVHSHVLDVAGHVYGDDPDRLRAVYQWVDDLVSWMRTYVDQLIILSDHGMENKICGDDEPGTHSWRAMVSTQGLSGPLPESALDVRTWLEERTDTTSCKSEDNVDVSDVEKHLIELGYIDE